MPEYDLLLQPGADLSQVVVHVEGAEGLSIAKDGSLVIETALGPLTQSLPKTWEVGDDGRKREVTCNFTLLGANRFGFDGSGWDGDTSLTIDPGLIWSTFSGRRRRRLRILDMSVDASGVVTVAGTDVSTELPDDQRRLRHDKQRCHDVFVSRLDPSKTGTAQLVYSTFLGETAPTTRLRALRRPQRRGDGGGSTPKSPDFPTTSGAYDTTLQRDRATRLRQPPGSEQDRKARSSSTPLSWGEVART